MTKCIIRECKTRISRQPAKITLEDLESSFSPSCRRDVFLAFYPRERRQIQPVVSRAAYNVAFSLFLFFFYLSPSSCVYQRDRDNSISYTSFQFVLGMVLTNIAGALSLSSRLPSLASSSPLPYPETSRPSEIAREKGRETKE